MLAVDVNQARKIDIKAVNKYKIPLVLLMENAGKAVADLILELKDSIDKYILFVVGVGNNGADGLVAARHLATANIPFKIIYTGNLAKASELFLLQKNILENMNVEIMSIDAISKSELKYIMQDAEYIVDGIMGTGLTGELRENVCEITNLINEADVKVISIDVPTGLQIDNGTLSSFAIVADYTVTMAALKLGMNLYPGKNNCGKIIVCNIGTPNVEEIIVDDRNIMVDKNMIKGILPVRNPICHKGDNGHVLIVGGCEGMYGAPLLSAEAAINSGAGKTTLGLRSSIFHDVMVKAQNEIMGAVLPIELNGELDIEGLRYITRDKDCIAIGPGMGRSLETKQILNSFLENYDGPLLLDADALYVLDQDIKSISNREIPTVITPHVGEFAHLTGYTAKYIERNRVAVAREFAKENGIILVLKGAPTVTALPNGTVFINTSGNPGMATGGMGDVLTGTIAAFIAQGLLIEEAVVLGVYLHGLSADILSEQQEIGYTASLVAKFIGKAFTNIMNDREG